MFKSQADNLFPSPSFCSHSSLFLQQAFMEQLFGVVGNRKIRQK